MAPLTDFWTAEPGAYIPPFDQLGLDPTSTNITWPIRFRCSPALRRAVIMTIPNAGIGRAQAARWLARGYFRPWPGLQPGDASGGCRQLCCGRFCGHRHRFSACTALPLTTRYSGLCPSANAVCCFGPRAHLQCGLHQQPDRRARRRTASLIRRGSRAELPGVPRLRVTTFARASQICRCWPCPSAD